MTVADTPSSERLRASYWAFAFTIAAAAVVVVLVWQTDEDTRWWLVGVPLLLTAAPLAVSRHRVRVAAAAGVTVFAVLTGASIGMYFVPAILALFAAASTIGRTRADV